MHTLDMLPQEYRAWFEQIKSTVRSAQAKAALSVNENLIRLYRQMGQMIDEKLENAAWGTGIVERLSADLQAEFPGHTGFSKDNLYFMRRFFLFYKGANPIVEQLVQQIPWGHNVLIFRKSGSFETAHFYLLATLENQWSRTMLGLNIETGLHERQGQALSNFAKTLPLPQAEMAQQTLKDPYVFDFLAMTPAMKELDLEKQLTSHIVRFLLELGAGFAFIGRQYPLQVGEKTYFLDLLFYHIRLRSFVAIDLKMTAFEPEFAGKMNFYLSAIDDSMRTETDNPSIGIILCKTKNRVEVEYALRDLSKPIGVSSWVLTRALPENLSTSFPTTEQLESEILGHLPSEQI